MKKTSITNNITYIQPKSMSNFKSCSGVILHGKQKICIDLNTGSRMTIDLLKQEKPDIAVITHYHLDHSIGTRHVKEHSNARILVPETEKNYLTSLDFVLKHTAGPFGLGPEWKQFITHDLGYKALDHTEGYTEDMPFDEFFPGMKAIHTPGHSPGHTSFYFSREKILFSGDMGLDRFGPWYGWKDCCIKDIAESILKLMTLDVRLILTSHGGIIAKDIHSAWIRSLKHLFIREQEIKNQLQSGADRSQIIERGVFFNHKAHVPQPMKSFLDMWDWSMLSHHEQLLLQGGLKRLFPELENRFKDHKRLN